MIGFRILAIIVLSSLVFPASAGGTRQLGTGGGTQLEGTSGGGIVPWATVTGYSTREEWGATAFLTRVEVDDFDLSSGGVAIGFNNRLELSLARQRLDISRLVPGARLQQDVVGIKYRLHGDLIYTASPQFSVGIQYKRNDDFTIPSSVGARNDSGTDIYLSATKMWLAGVAGYNAFANTTVRFTEANQLGLLGYGGDLGSGRDVVLEASLGLFLTRKLALGLEYRQKPNNLSSVREDDWSDVFVAYFPNRNWSILGAYVDLGKIADLPRQNGIYLSVEGGF